MNDYSENNLSSLKISGGSATKPVFVIGFILVALLLVISISLVVLQQNPNLEKVVFENGKNVFSFGKSINSLIAGQAIDNGDSIDSDSESSLSKIRL